MGFCFYFLQRYKNRKKLLTKRCRCVTMISGTFYFWSLKSVQRRADKCCKVHTDMGCHRVLCQPK
ncbi:L-fuculose kinase [Streptococcus ratti]|nr:L-fuculose kinase [Streptococcus ratti]